MSDLQLFEEEHLTTMGRFNSNNWYCTSPLPLIQVGLANYYSIKNHIFLLQSLISHQLFQLLWWTPWTLPTSTLCIMAELFPSANNIQSSDVTDMPLDAAFYSSDIPFIPADQPITTSFQYSPPNQSTSPMMSFATSRLWDISNTNFINFAVNACDTSHHLIQKDDRSMAVSVSVSHLLLCANY